MGWKVLWGGVAVEGGGKELNSLVGVTTWEVAGYHMLLVLHPGKVWQKFAVIHLLQSWCQFQEFTQLAVCRDSRWLWVLSCSPDLMKCLSGGGIDGVSSCDSSACDIVVHGAVLVYSSGGYVSQWDLLAENKIDEKTNSPGRTDSHQSKKVSLFARKSIPRKDAPFTSIPVSH